MNREFLKTVLSTKEDKYDAYFSENNKDISKQDLLESVKEVMSQSPMKKIRDEEDGLTYQHPDLPVFFMIFTPKEDKIHITSEIAPKDYTPSGDHSRYITKEAYAIPTDLESLYKAIDEVSYVTKEDVRNLPEPRSKLIKEAIQYFLDNSWI